MLSLIRIIPKQLSLINNFTSSRLSRTLYTPASFAIDSFEAYKTKIEREDPGRAESVRKTIKDVLSKPNSPLFTEDLKSLAYSTKTDSDIDLLVAAFKKYSSQDSVAIFNFNFDAILMRVLYSLKKTDIALELYLNEEKFCKSVKVANMLMNKLLEESRYDDVVKVFDKLSKRYQAEKDTFKNVFISFNLVTEALLLKNDKEALKKAKSILENLIALKCEVSDLGLTRIYLLALQQKDPQFAYELILKFTNRGQNIINNLKILALLDLNRNDEALQIATVLNSSQLPNPNMKKFYKITLDRLTEAFSNDPDKKKKIDDIKEDVQKNSQLMPKDLKESALQLFTIQKRFDNDRNQENQTFGNIKERKFGYDQGERRNFNPNNGFQDPRRRNENFPASSNRRNFNNFDNRRPQQQQGQNRRQTNQDDDN